MFENPFSKDKDSPRIPQVGETYEKILISDSSTIPINLNTLLDQSTEDIKVDTTEEMAAQFIQQEYILPSDIPSSFFIPNSKKEVAVEKVLTSTPKWDGTPRSLNLQQDVENVDDISNDD
ncbi:hypothetical protein HAX54_027025 [Datura stramonium]|uniref:Uncharacterized protein n=1 Tax=Datura stramonium TaxID=4076 RepID=A0ABS8V4C8_DATST|nr:hypothetical protein [Datura stramonium]